jgi:hypothetical protein
LEKTRVKHFKRAQDLELLQSLGGGNQATVEELSPINENANLYLDEEQ